MYMYMYDYTYACTVHVYWIVVMWLSWSIICLHCAVVIRLLCGHFVYSYCSSVKLLNKQVFVEILSFQSSFVLHVLIDTPDVF